ncbi:hypothetical protein HN709_01080 [Candidatus Peregrinibacteria bacterium]|jgi:hypothetical protein|nr:hypothetical protein [Candidatus Peregrinibacteria bacterium]MBT7736257.1 hypothetical protein [Candidatus Peregrinibacteria bacterium]
MRKIDLFLTEVSELIEKEFIKRKQNWIQEKSFTVSIYDIFDRNYKIEEAYKELLKLFRDRKYGELIPDIKNIYKTTK